VFAGFMGAMMPDAVMSGPDWPDRGIRRDIGIGECAAEHGEHQYRENSFHILILLQRFPIYNYPTEKVPVIKSIQP
jgi:hypothetical protein